MLASYAHCRKKMLLLPAWQHMALPEKSACQTFSPQHAS